MDPASLPWAQLGATGAVIIAFLYMIRVTLPNLQKECREERKELIDAYREETKADRTMYREEAAADRNLFREQVEIVREMRQ